MISPDREQVYVRPSDDGQTETDPAAMPQAAVPLQLVPNVSPEQSPGGVSPKYREVVYKDDEGNCHETLIRDVDPPTIARIPFQHLTKGIRMNPVTGRAEFFFIPVDETDEQIAARDTAPEDVERERSIREAAETSSHFQTGSHLHIVQTDEMSA